MVGTGAAKKNVIPPKCQVLRPSCTFKLLFSIPNPFHSLHIFLCIFPLPTVNTKISTLKTLLSRIRLCKKIYVLKKKKSDTQGLFHQCSEETCKNSPNSEIKKNIRRKEKCYFKSKDVRLRIKKKNSEIKQM